MSSANDPSSTSQLASVLGFMVRAVALLGLAAVAYGPAYTYLAVRLVYGERWAATEAPAVLGVYCAYILLLALNGEWWWLYCVELSMCGLCESTYRVRHVQFVVLSVLTKLRAVLFLLCLADGQVLYGSLCSGCFE